MRTRNAVAVGFCANRLFTTLLLVMGLAPATLHAQLVADGGTLILNTATNLAGDLTIGTNGGNTLLSILSPGTVTNANGTIGLNATSTNNLVVVRNAGAIWNNSGDLYVGYYGSGNQLVVSNGAAMTSTIGNLGYYSSSDNNTALITGAGSLWSNSLSLFVGYTGGGNQLVVSNSAVVANDDGYVGAISANNTALITGAGSSWNNGGDLHVGDSESSGNQLVVSNGAVVVNSTGVIGYYGVSANNTALITGAGSTWTNAGNLLVGRAGSGNTLRLQSGGSASSAGSAYIGNNSGSSNNLLHVDGGTLTVAANLDVRRGTLQLDSGQVTAANLIATNGSQGSIIFNGGVLPVMSYATLSVSNTVINNGSPLVAGNGSPAVYQLLGSGLHAFNDGLIISDGAFLRGSGTIDGLLTVSAGGLIDFSSAGSSLQRLTLSNSPSLSGGIRMRLRVTGGLTNDLVSVPTAALSYGGVLEVTRLGGASPAGGNSFKLFDAASYAGAFTSMSLPTLNAGLMWTNRLLLDGSIAVIPLTPPVISGVTQAGTNLVFDVTGGPPGGERGLWTSPNIAIPLDSWQYLGPIHFDWLGNATVTNGISFPPPARFFAVGPTQI